MPQTVWSGSSENTPPRGVRITCCLVFAKPAFLGPDRHRERLLARLGRRQVLELSTEPELEVP